MKSRAMFPTVLPITTLSTFLLVGLIVFGAIRYSRSQVQQTDLNLVIAIDCSFSVNAREFQLQVEGIATALLSPEVTAAVASGQHGRIGVTIFQWSGPDIQAVVVPWVVIASPGDATRVAEELRRQPRHTAAGETAIGSALDFATELLDNAPFFAERQVIDIQGDGTSTWSRGIPVSEARDRAVAQGITINGLPILNEVPHLNRYFENHVIGGPGSFVEIADDYRAFAEAMKRKLLREIRPVNLS